MSSKTHWLNMYTSTRATDLYSKCARYTDTLQGVCYWKSNSTNLERRFDLPVSEKPRDCDTLSNKVLFKRQITPELQRLEDWEPEIIKIKES